VLQQEDNPAQLRGRVSEPVDAKFGESVCNPAESSGGAPAQFESVSLLGVDYFHMKTADGGDLYLTKFGVPFWRNLLPQNWYAREWFESKRERLEGSSTIYKVPTRPVDGRELQLVVKWSRVGEAVPLDTLTVTKFINAEFNSPFEEFALLMELRRGELGPPDVRVRTQRPLAIYVPSERLQLWQTGRSEDKIRAKIARHPGVELDILRQYVLLFGWIDGVDAVKAAETLGLEGRVRAEFFARITSLANHELLLKGYRVIDMKPEHVIVRFRRSGKLLRERNGQIAYALVDYELLERTPEHEQAVRMANRQLYLKHMAQRFEVQLAKPPPAHLRATNLLGVDYIFGRAESTGGLIWVVGKDPDLFNYFLPERWRRTPKRSLSARNRVFHTRTKDNINLVWKVSRMGELPELSEPHLDAHGAKMHGYNSPFEEFAYAFELARAGIKTVYPRAIYMTGRKGRTPPDVEDDRRFDALAHLRTPDGEPAIRKDYDYITIWGYWNGPDELLAVHDGSYYTAVNVKQAQQQGLISADKLDELLDLIKTKLAAAGFEDLNLKPDHLLMSLGPDGRIVLDETGKPELRLCNLELVHKISGSQPDTG